MKRSKTVFAEYPKIIKSIKQPTLIIQGINGPYIPIEHAVRLSNDIENSKLVVLEKTGHFIPIDVPAFAGSKIGKFLNGKE
ncbi:MAG: alpha/beta hydrolase [Bacteroidales bacterium]|nr:alpha/beta hydrolase [Bacteroidales bacterium]